MDERVQQWAEAIRQRPELYRLGHFGPYVSVERAAAYFAEWERAELAGEPRPALCRRCGRLLRDDDIARPHIQTHIQCDPVRPKEST
jgi:hypothetical protein